MAVRTVHITPTTCTYDRQLERGCGSDRSVGLMCLMGGHRDFETPGAMRVLSQAKRPADADDRIRQWATWGRGPD
jgi:hypothetical protein